MDRAEKQLDFEKDARDDIQDQLDQAEKACAASGGTPSSASVDTSGLLSGILGQTDSNGDGDDDSAEERKKKLEAALKAAGSLAGSLVSSSAAAANPACSQVATLQSAETQAERQVEASKTALDAAQNRRDVDEAAGRVQVENARQGLVTAQNNLDSASTDRPSLIAQQRGLVAAFRPRSPRRRRTSTTPSCAPPRTARSRPSTARSTRCSPRARALPHSRRAARAPSPGPSSANGSAGVVTRPGGTQFIAFNNVDTFEAVVPFEESDAVRVTPNQRVDVRFDAIPDLTLPGTVVGVSPSASALSGVISYYATVGLSQSDPRLRNGLTAQASVITDELRDVLAVPNAAIHRQGGRTQVTLQRFDGQRVVDITPGVVGDTYTQALRGCRRATRSSCPPVAERGEGGGPCRARMTGPRQGGPRRIRAVRLPPAPRRRRSRQGRRGLKRSTRVALLVILVLAYRGRGVRGELLPRRAQLRHHGQRAGRRRQAGGQRARRAGRSSTGARRRVRS